MTYREKLVAAATGRRVPFEFQGVTYLLRPLTQGELTTLPDGGRESMNRLFSLAVVDEDGGRVFAEEDAAAMPEADVMAVAQEAMRRCNPDPKADAAGNSTSRPSSA